MKKIVLMMAAPVLFSMTSCNDQPKTAEYSGIDLTGKVEILRDKKTKSASLVVDFDSQWKLYAGPSVEKIDFSAPIAEGSGKAVYPLEGVSKESRSYFQFVSPEGKAILAETHLPMTGGFNFRDLGGIRTKDGRYVKWGKIIRSDDLYSLTDADLTYLSSLPLVSIVDFRSPEEMEAQPDRVPASVKHNYPYSISPGNMSSMVDDMDGLSDLTENHTDAMMMDLNRMLVTDAQPIDHYRKFFTLLQDETKVPLLFHCSAGKDRTGMGAALILFSLGVDEATILENYLASNEYLAEKYASYTAEYPQLTGLFQVQPEYIRAGIEQIKEDHGSVENFLVNELQVDLEKMKSMYLY